MRKIIATFIIAVGLLGAGVLWLSQKSATRIPSQTAAPREKVPFDTTDNLDQAISDLGQVE